MKADDEGIAGPSATKNKLAIKPKGKARKRLNEKGKATVKARVTYSPKRASPKTVVKTITLVEGVGPRSRRVVGVGDVAGERRSGQELWDKESQMKEGKGRRKMRKLVPIAVAVALVTAVPTGAEAKTQRISSSIRVDLFGIINRHGADVRLRRRGGAERFMFGCMGDRKVKLFRVEPNGLATLVASTATSFNTFVGVVERPLGAITGSYYAELVPSNRKFKRGKHRKLRCLAARSPTIFVEVPAGLLNP